MPAGGRSSPSCSSSASKRSRSSARSIASGDVPRIGTPARSSGTASLSGVWPPNCTITPSGFSVRDDLEHVLERERLEVQAVAGVVVGRDGLGVAVHHDRLEARLAQREGRVHAAVVELDALPDPVRPAAEDHDLAAVRRPRLALVLVGRIEVGRVRLELGGAGVDALVDGPHALAPAQRAHVVLAQRPRAPPRRASEKPALLGGAQPGDAVRRRCVAAASPRSSSTISSRLRRNQGSIARAPVELLDARRRGAAPRRSPTDARAAACRSARQSAATPASPAGSSGGSSPAWPISSERSAFWRLSLKVRPIAITSPTDFICVVSSSSTPRELLEGEARDLRHDVVDRRLEARPASRA